LLLSLFNFDDTDSIGLILAMFKLLCLSFVFIGATQACCGLILADGIWLRALNIRGGAIATESGLLPFNHILNMKILIIKYIDIS